MGKTKELPPGRQETIYTPDQQFDSELLTAFENVLGKRNEEGDDDVYDTKSHFFRWVFQDHPSWAQKYINLFELHPEDGYAVIGGSGLHYSQNGSETPGRMVPLGRITLESNSKVLTIESLPENGMITIYTIPIRAHYSEVRKAAPLGSRVPFYDPNHLPDRSDHGEERMP